MYRLHVAILFCHLSQILAIPRWISLSFDNIKIQTFKGWTQRERKRFLASRLFPERGKDESSARVIVARNFNPPLASPRSFLRFPSRSARFSGPGKGRQDKKLQNGKQRILARLSESPAAYTAGLSFRLFCSKMGLRPSQLHSEEVTIRSVCRSFFGYSIPPLDGNSRITSTREAVIIIGEKEKITKALCRRRIKNIGRVWSLWGFAGRNTSEEIHFVFFKDFCARESVTGRRSSQSEYYLSYYFFSCSVSSCSHFVSYKFFEQFKINSSFEKREFNTTLMMTEARRIKTIKKRWRKINYHYRIDNEVQATEKTDTSLKNS